MKIDLSKAAADLGRAGGAARSDRKSAAVRANGKLGGRPATTRLLFCVRGPNDGRDFAGTVAEILVPQRLAVRLARSLENWMTGMAADEALLRRFKPAVDEAARSAGGELAGGHGIAVVYPSGRKIQVRREW
jgi:hypothetical protein